jgi:hypothetical protein
MSRTSKFRGKRHFIDSVPGCAYSFFMIIIPQADIKVGETVDFEGKTYKADQHFSQGKDMLGKGYTHLMYTNTGAFNMVEAE